MQFLRTVLIEKIKKTNFATKCHLQRYFTPQKRFLKLVTVLFEQKRFFCQQRQILIEIIFGFDVITPL